MCNSTHHILPYYHTATTLHERENYSEAIESFRQALLLLEEESVVSKKHPLIPKPIKILKFDIYSLLADCYWKLKNYPNALFCFSKAATHTSPDMPTNIWIRFYQDAGFSALDAASANTPLNENVTGGLLRFSKFCLESCLALDPTNSQVMGRLLRVYIDIGDMRRALQTCRKISEFCTAANRPTPIKIMWLLSYLSNIWDDDNIEPMPSVPEIDLLVTNFLLSTQKRCSRIALDYQHERLEFNGTKRVYINLDEGIPKTFFDRIVELTSVTNLIEPFLIIITKLFQQPLTSINTIIKTEEIQSVMRIPIKTSTCCSSSEQLHWETLANDICASYMEEKSSSHGVSNQINKLSGVNLSKQAEENQEKLLLNETVLIDITTSRPRMRQSKTTRQLGTSCPETSKISTALNQMIKLIEPFFHSSISDLTQTTPYNLLTQLLPTSHPFPRRHSIIYNFGQQLSKTVESIDTLSFNGVQTVGDIFIKVSLYLISHSVHLLYPEKFYHFAKNVFLHSPATPIELLTASEAFLAVSFRQEKQNVFKWMDAGINILEKCPQNHFQLPKLWLISRALLFIELGHNPSYTEKCQRLNPIQTHERRHILHTAKQLLHQCQKLLGISSENMNIDYMESVIPTTESIKSLLEIIDDEEKFLDVCLADFRHEGDQQQYKTLEKCAVAILDYLNTDKNNLEEPKELDQWITFSTTIKNVSERLLYKQLERTKIFHLTDDINDICQERFQNAVEILSVSFTRILSFIIPYFSNRRLRFQIQTNNSFVIKLSEKTQDDPSLHLFNHLPPSRLKLTPKEALLFDLVIETFGNIFSLNVCLSPDYTHISDTNLHPTLVQRRKLIGQSPIKDTHNEQSFAKQRATASKRLGFLGTGSGLVASLSVLLSSVQNTDFPDNRQTSNVSNVYHFMSGISLYLTLDVNKHYLEKEVVIDMTTPPPPRHRSISLESTSSTESDSIADSIDAPTAEPPLILKFRLTTQRLLAGLICLIITDLNACSNLDRWRITNPEQRGCPVTSKIILILSRLRFSLQCLCEILITPLQIPPTFPITDTLPQNIHQLWRLGPHCSLCIKNNQNDTCSDTINELFTNPISNKFLPQQSHFILDYLNYLIQLIHGILETEIVVMRPLVTNITLASTIGVFPSLTTIPGVETLYITRDLQCFQPWLVCRFREASSIFENKIIWFHSRLSVLPGLATLSLPLYLLSITLRLGNINVLERWKRNAISELYHLMPTIVQLDSFKKIQMDPVELLSYLPQHYKESIIDCIIPSITQYPVIGRRHQFSIFYYYGGASVSWETEMSVAGIIAVALLRLFGLPLYPRSGPPFDTCRQITSEDFEDIIAFAHKKKIITRFQSFSPICLLLMTQLHFKLSEWFTVSSSRKKQIITKNFRAALTEAIDSSIFLDQPDEEKIEDYQSTIVSQPSMNTNLLGLFQTDDDPIHLSMPSFWNIKAFGLWTYLSDPLIFPRMLEKLDDEEEQQHPDEPSHVNSFASPQQKNMAIRGICPLLQTYGLININKLETTTQNNFLNKNELIVGKYISQEDGEFILWGNGEADKTSQLYEFHTNVLKLENIPIETSIIYYPFKEQPNNQHHHRYKIQQYYWRPIKQFIHYKIGVASILNDLFYQFCSSTQCCYKTISCFYGYAWKFLFEILPLRPCILCPKLLSQLSYCDQLWGDRLGFFMKDMTIHSSRSGRTASPPKYSSNTIMPTTLNASSAQYSVSHLQTEDLINNLANTNRAIALGHLGLKTLSAAAYSHRQLYLFLEDRTTMESSWTLLISPMPTISNTILLSLERFQQNIAVQNIQFTSCHMDTVQFTLRAGVQTLFLLEIERIIWGDCLYRQFMLEQTKQCEPNYQTPTGISSLNTKIELSSSVDSDLTTQYDNRYQQSEGFQSLNVEFPLVASNITENILQTPLLSSSIQDNPNQYESMSNVDIDMGVSESSLKNEGDYRKHLIKRLISGLPMSHLRSIDCFALYCRTRVERLLVEFVMVTSVSPLPSGSTLLMFSEYNRSYTHNHIGCLTGQLFPLEIPELSDICYDTYVSRIDCCYNNAIRLDQELIDITDHILLYQFENHALFSGLSAHNKRYQFWGMSFGSDITSQLLRSCIWVPSFIAGRCKSKMAKIQLWKHIYKTQWTLLRSTHETPSTEDKKNVLIPQTPIIQHDITHPALMSCHPTDDTYGNHTLQMNKTHHLKKDDQFVSIELNIIINYLQSLLYYLESMQKTVMCSDSSVIQHYFTDQKNNVLSDTTPLIYSQDFLLNHHLSNFIATPLIYLEKLRLKLLLLSNILSKNKDHTTSLWILPGLCMSLSLFQNTNPSILNSLYIVCQKYHTEFNSIMSHDLNQLDMIQQQFFDELLHLCLPPTLTQSHVQDHVLSMTITIIDKYGKYYPSMSALLAQYYLFSNQLQDAISMMQTLMIRGTIRQNKLDERQGIAGFHSAHQNAAYYVYHQTIELRLKRDEKFKYKIVLLSIALLETILLHILFSLNDDIIDQLHPSIDIISSSSSSFTESVTHNEQYKIIHLPPFIQSRLIHFISDISLTQMPRSHHNQWKCIRHLETEVHHLLSQSIGFIVDCIHSQIKLSKKLSLSILTNTHTTIHNHTTDINESPMLLRRIIQSLLSIIETTIMYLAALSPPHPLSTIMFPSNHHIQLPQNNQFIINQFILKQLASILPLMTHHHQRHDIIQGLTTLASSLFIFDVNSIQTTPITLQPLFNGSACAIIECHAPHMIPHNIAVRLSVNDHECQLMSPLFSHSPSETNIMSVIRFIGKDGTNTCLGQQTQLSGGKKTASGLKDDLIKKRLSINVTDIDCMKKKSKKSEDNSGGSDIDTMTHSHSIGS